MENAIHSLTLDLTGPDMRPVVEVQQDNARSLVISLTQGGRPYWIAEGVTAVFSGRKPDGKPLFNACTIEKNRVRYDFTDQTTNVAGIVECEILLYSGDERILASPRFELAIDELIHKDTDVPESAPELNALTQMVAAGTAMIEDLRAALGELENVEEMLEQAQTAAQSAARSEEAAGRAAGTAQSASSQAQASAQRAFSSAEGAAESLEKAIAAGKLTQQLQQQAEAARDSAGESAAQASGYAETASASAEQAGAALQQIGTVVGSSIESHNVGRYAHSDIREGLRALADRVNAALNSDDATLDQLSEIVAYITSNKTLIDAITTSKVSVADIINNLTTNVANKPLSAAQGVVLAGRIEELKKGGTGNGSGQNVELPPIYNMDSNTATDGHSGGTRTESVELTIDGSPYDNSNYAGGFYTGPNAKRSDYIPITDDMVSIYLSTHQGPTACAMAFYDSAKTRIEELDILGDEAYPQIVEVDLSDGKYASAKYFIVSYHDPGKVYQYYECTCTFAGAAVEAHNGLNILVFGDSITETANITIDDNGQTASYATFKNQYQDASGKTIVYDNWPNLVPEILNCYDVRNYAESGATYKDLEQIAGHEQRNLSYQVQLALNDVNNANGVFPSERFEPDIVIFALGTNDGVPNDTPESAMGKTVLAVDGFSLDADATLAALDRTKFCEAALWAFLTVKKAFPMAMGFCVLPIQRAQGETNANELHDRLEAVAKRYGFIIVDGAFESGIIRDLEVRNDLGTMLKDGLHPNEKGQNLLCRAVLTAIRRHYLPFDGMNK